MSDGWVRRQERTRRDVIDAVGALIAESGVDGVTMRKLAERAGVAVATLYNQFGDRDGVIVAFVSSGLDQLEIDLDAQPPVGPVDTTRTLLDAFDETFLEDPAVWRSIFASLKSGSGSYGMGEVGERVVQYINTDLAKAAADGMFVVDVDTEVVARALFQSQLHRLEKWAHGVIDWEQYRESSRLGLELALAGLLAEPWRSESLRASGAIRNVPGASRPARPSACADARR
ncbi:MAG: TetR/AcrR family transcriptional regulator [Ilumatobacter sp.]|jgi:AcrR family transcriptional regulator|uniref:TetR/AcrR family transcriptional regulator n=1 Tax=Ilumatobacter sp. TaxID=1967498 RepID=UPI003918BB89